MKILFTDIKDVDCACDVLILPFFEDDRTTSRDLKPSIDAMIKKVRKNDFKASLNDLLLLPAPSDIKPEKILFVGLGKRSEFNRERLRQAGGKAASHVRERKAKAAAISVPFFEKSAYSLSDFVEGALLGLYTFRRYKKEDNENALSRIYICGKVSGKINDQIRRVEITASAVSYARDLVNTPANDMTPSDLANEAMKLKSRNLAVRVLEKREIQKIGMGAFLAVSYGSNQPPKFIIAEYKGSKKPPFVLVGKSITFDSGGLSIKPSDGMDKMKYDMAGGAAVLGALKAVSELGIPVHLICLLPASENLSGGCATRPGDVVRSLSGKTVEIANTDAEGRLAIADAIEYAKRFNPRAVIDIATLTGACAIAFGGEMAAAIGNDGSIMDALVSSGDDTYERLCRLPLCEEYRDYLRSDIADIRNIGNRTGSLMSSGAFLSEFAGDVPWVHIDIAGTAWTEKERPYVPKGASGIGVRLLVNFLERMK